MRTRLIGLALAGLGLAVGPNLAARAEILGDYLGYRACQECHAEIVASWQKTPHAHAFAGLKRQGEEKQGIPGCVRCHVVAFEQDGGFIDMGLTPELADVQCEACHGPGKKHVEAGGDGQIVAKPDANSCRVCHTEGQDKNFDYQRKSKLVHDLAKGGKKGAK